VSKRGDNRKRGKIHANNPIHTSGRHPEPAANKEEGDADAPPMIAPHQSEIQNPNTAEGRGATKDEQYPAQRTSGDVLIARWTRVLGVSTTLLVLATGGLIYIGHLQWTTLEKTDHTLKDTLTTNKATQRAFINVSELKQEPAVRLDGVKYWNVTPVIKNTGNTPALGVSVVVVGPHGEWRTRPKNIDPRDYGFLSYKVGAPRDPDEIFDNPPDSPPDFLKRNISIGPQGTISASGITSEITAQTALDAMSDKVGRFIYGSIRYFDAFDSFHVSKFCFRIDGFYLRTVGDTMPKQDVCSHWNCTDEYCQKDKEDYRRDLSVAAGELRERKARPPLRPPFLPPAPPQPQ
jgi:hypothetical protein